MAKTKPNEPRDPPTELALEFETIAIRALAEMHNENLSAGVQVQWARVALDAIKALKDEQRINDGLGAGVVYRMILTPPAPLELPVPEKGEMN